MSDLDRDDFERSLSWVRRNMLLTENQAQRRLLFLPAFIPFRGLPRSPWRSVRHGPDAAVSAS